MSPELEHLCRLLGVLLDIPRDERPEPPPPRDWRRWSALVELHQLAPLIGNRIAGGLRVEAMPAALAGELVAAAATEAREAAVREAAWYELSDLLNRSGLAWAALKGMAVTPDLYGCRCERTMADVDLLFGSPDTAAEAGRVLADAGFRAAAPLPAHHHLPALRDDSNLLRVELHHDLCAPPLSRAMLDLVWARRVTTPAGPRLDDPARLLHHALHIANDPVDSPVLRNLFECAALASRLSPGAWEDFTRLTEASGRGPVVAEVLSDAADLAGSPRLLPSSRSPLGFWIRRRLEGLDGNGRVKRLLRQVARTHVESAQAAGRLRPFWRSLAAAFALVAFRRPDLRAPVRVWQALPCPHLRIGSATLVHRPDTGEVHLLQEPAARIWLAAHSESDPGVLFTHSGLNKADFDTTLTTLATAGLLKKHGGK